MLTCFDIRMIWLRRFHRYKVLASCEIKNNTNIRTAGILIVLYFFIATM